MAKDLGCRLAYEQDSPDCLRFQWLEGKRRRIGRGGGAKIYGRNVGEDEDSVPRGVTSPCEKSLVTEGHLKPGSRIVK